ncbi:phosphoribosylglycinamide formyltransferase [Flavobacterium columnare NBRC 100251 = ATCC 23463]|uniref:phosphoribosylglycinamide formyltransferase 1 n=1 Tax=Flavobacterium columnare (strain ATCC 49512 / CIP 103533 / TG 44/87) TaxID=1041826 RepID=G8XBL8_FLACA|nr:phosphoribosylglycinamide formyltransferase [Flavobacterium columnare]AEW87433.1 phosphoribosylglycinamide formyltransferase [Flavobacterium columnare ATCC 49512]ANO49491.1 phosphoribosylglycinamide formyltransferase [Flavobacterium columnare]APT22549.1 phosphoribosylglycinamide formyltransferase [Flavobacterium columnare]MBF6651861.1 phosphoribosylglycinamide formyltransferase [Flavobacterium columnare]MBF6655482.1 phosphoribosylglycinamide formyltransferase [Flavobacterium columnare]
MKKIVLFASGSGSNAEKIILHFKSNPKITVTQVYSNNLNAKVLERAKNHGIPTLTFTKEDLNSGFVLNQLNESTPDLIVLAGFLLKFPKNIITAYPNRVINIHPALLPKYGGKGMYGMNVHQAVLENKEKETGITIHYVNEHYDEGAIIAQYATNIENCKKAEEIATAVHLLEHTYFSIEIEKLLNS